MLQLANVQISFSERKILLRCFDVFAVLLSLYLAETYFNFNYFTLSLDNFYWTFVLAVYLNVLGTIFEMYNLQVASHQFYIIRSIVLTTSATVFFYLMTPFFTPLLPLSRLQILYFFLAVFGALFSWRIFYQTFLASHIFEKKAILVCKAEQLYELVDSLESANPHYKVKAFVNSCELGTYVGDLLKIQKVDISDLENYLRNHAVSEIVVASGDSEIITVGFYNQLIEMLQNGVMVREYSQVYEEMTQRLPVQYLSRDFHLFFPFGHSNQNELHLFFTRFFDIVFSIVGLLATLLLLPIVLLGNLIANQGPLLYIQERVGKNGKVFKIYKYRTMVIDAEVEGAAYAKVNDVRVTRWGKMMRKTRLDEFPQFINVLKGEMAIIGPRPERPVFVKDLVRIMPFYETRHVIKPGLTGWAQVNYTYGSNFDDSLVKLQYDLYYIKHRNLILDMIILLRTITTVLFYRGQ